jgi:sterol desaturase/sphingolipid hydroxylase (fatty acid hydroxylase superfamily)
MEASTPKKVKMQYTMHGVHHDYPKDKQRLAMPPFLSVTISTILLLIFELLLDKYSFSFLAGFLVGYAFYLLVHYSVHIFRMPNNFLKALWINHSIHHYSPEDAMFGVSSPIWDYVFGTANKKKGTGNVEVKV